MRGYLGWAWNPSDGVANATADAWCRELRDAETPWSCLLKTKGFVVFARESAEFPGHQCLPIGCGVLFGSVFAKPSADVQDDGVEPLTLGSKESQRLLSSGGRALMESCWGDYVTLFREWASPAVWVVRAPCATIPCLHVCVDRIQLYGAHMEDLVALTGARFSIDRIALARSFLGPSPQGRTHLLGVREVIGGDGDRIYLGDVSSWSLWHPPRQGNRLESQDFDTAARRLRQTVRFCARSRAREFQRVLVALSGGLDSSIILASVAGLEGAAVQSATQFVEDTESDERHWARLAAHRAGSPLHELRRQRTADLRTAMYSKCLEVSPGLRIPEVDNIEIALARSVGASAILDGNGGDELFCRVHTGLYVSDYLRAHGPRSEFFRLLMHAAHSEGTTVWEALIRCVSDAFVPRVGRAVSLLAKNLRGSTVLTDDAIAELLVQAKNESENRFADYPPGRLWQLSLLTARRTRPAPHARPGDATRCSALISQPLLELDVPTWFHIRGRRDRALARHAFSVDLPTEILRRAEKPSCESVATTIIDDNREFLRELLLDGQMVSLGVIDAPKLRCILGDPLPRDGITSVPLFDLVGAELWMRAWANHDRQRDVSNRQRQTALYIGSSS